MPELVNQYSLALQALMLMFATLLVGLLSGFDAVQLGLMCWIYAITRLLHMALYYAIATEKNPSPRSYFYSIGLLVNVMLIVMVTVHLLSSR